MKLFICWSGVRGQALAGVMAKRLPEIIEGVQPFVSTGIAKGRLWFLEVGEHLRSASAGLICLTRESLGSSWIHYEAGVLARAVSEREEAQAAPGRIFTYLLDVDPTEVVGPLSAYQSSVATREDTRLLVESMAGALKSSENWLARFEEVWPQLEKDLVRIGRLLLPSVFRDFARLFKRKTFDEPLASCTGQSWFDRYAGALETKLALQRMKRTVESECRPYVSVLFDKLIGEIDGYAMDMSSLLLDERKFKVSDGGSLAIEPRGIEVACERRRLQIKKLVSDLIDPRRAPVSDEACAFALLETFEEKKNLIHSIEAKISKLVDFKRDAAAASDWDLDRITWYLVQDWLISERRKPVSIPEAVDSTRIELEKVGAKPERSVGLMPLHYSRAPIKACLRRLAEGSSGQSEMLQIAEKALDELQSVLDRVASLLEEKDSNRNPQLRRELR
jgi:hypothetical protein